MPYSIRAAPEHLWGCWAGPQDPKDVIRDTARDLSALVGKFAALKGDAAHWLTDPAYTAVRHRLEATHAAAEAAMVSGINERGS